MDASSFYNKSASNKRRTLDEGKLDPRNAHNFIKSVLIKQNVTNKSTVLDLGCGKGGDVYKFYLSSVSLYVGVDTCKNSLKMCKTRLSKQNSMNYKLVCDTLWSKVGFAKNVDVVSSQFAFHYCFESEECAHKTVVNVKESLKQNGLFIGTIPISNVSYIKTLVCLPGYEESFMEPTVDLNTFETLLTSNGFAKILLESFPNYYEQASASEKDLFLKMKANFFGPSSDYYVFIFKRL